MRTVANGKGAFQLRSPLLPPLVDRALSPSPLVAAVAATSSTAARHALPVVVAVAAISLTAAVPLTAAAAAVTLLRVEPARSVNRLAVVEVVDRLLHDTLVGGSGRDEGAESLREGKEA